MCSNSYSFVKGTISLEYYIDKITDFQNIFRFVQNVVQTIKPVHATKLPM